MDENSEFDKLAKDSVSSDDDHSQSREEKWISQFLDKVEPLLKITGTEIVCKFFEFIFHKASFSGDSMVHVCVKSDDLQLMDRLWEILHKFQLYNLLHLRNYNKETCLHLASAMNRPKLLKEAIIYGADVNSVDVDGNTALHVAIREKHNGCATVILTTDVNQWEKVINIDLSVLNDNGYTPLHLASMSNNLTVLKMLDAKASQMKKPIFDDVEGKHGNNALHIAIESEARELAEYLIQNKSINPSKMNKSGHTALYLARVVKANDLVNLMQRHSLIDDKHIMDDEDDASSKDSFESQEISKKTEVKGKKNYRKFRKLKRA